MRVANSIKDFLSLVPFDDPDESVCSLWKGHIHNGYGQFRNKIGIDIYPHRAIWEMERGPIPKGMCVCHHCDNPLCVRMSHLFLGTQKDNIKDRNAKGRTARGEKNGSALLVEEQVQAIRNLSSTGISNKVIADAFQVSHQTVWEVATRRRWTHI
jgi:hypothetical protein